MKSYHLFFILLLVSACSSTKRAEKEFGENLFQHWAHAHEEDQSEYRAFRPADYDLPPSRGREGFKIQQNGSFLHYPIGAADAPKEVSATWKLSGKSTLVVTPSSPGAPPFELHILQVEKELLKIGK